jgi:hypothetical protein
MLKHMAHELLGDYDSDNSSHDDFDPINENTAALAKVKKRKGANFVQKVRLSFTLCGNLMFTNPFHPIDEG